MPQIKFLELNALTKYFTPEKASFKRGWADKHEHNFVYRCLPLKIANEAGWIIRNPVGFEAVYHENKFHAESVELRFDEPHPANQSINSHFGRGIITWQIPFLMVTEKPYSTLIQGVPNEYKENIAYLQAIVETFWAEMAWTYSVRITKPETKVRFEKDEPLLFLTLINLDIINETDIIIEPIAKHPEIAANYEKFSKSRNAFNADPNRGPLDWEKRYFNGIKSDGSLQCPHLNKMNNSIVKKDA